MRIGIESEKKFNELPPISKAGRVLQRLCSYVFCLHIILFIFEFVTKMNGWIIFFSILGVLIGFYIELKFDKKRKVKITIGQYYH